MQISKAFGAAVRAARERAGISQEALAEEAELDRTYVSGVERGVRNPTLRTITRLAAALRVTESQLFEEAAKIGKKHTA